MWRLRQFGRSRLSQVALLLALAGQLAGAIGLPVRLRASIISSPRSAALHVGHRHANPNLLLLHRRRYKWPMPLLLRGRRTGARSGERDGEMDVDAGGWPLSRTRPAADWFPPAVSALPGITSRALRRRPSGLACRHILVSHSRDSATADSASPINLIFFALNHLP